jgi:uroporphyrinogen decarboxylase
VLHPLQAKAKNMNADYLAEHFKGKIAFMGGVDAQDILPFGTPDEVRKETRRVMNLLGPNLIVCPSHETLLPNIPMENIVVMQDEAFR